MNSTKYTITELKNALNHLENNSREIHVSLEALERQLKYVPVLRTICDVLSAVRTTGPSQQTRMELRNQLTPEGYVKEVVPTIKLGRRAGHTTAVAQYIQDNPDKQTVVILPHAMMLDEYSALLGLPTTSVGQSYIRYNPNILITTQAFFSVPSKVESLGFSLKPNTLVIVESESHATTFLTQLAKTTLHLVSSKFVVVGN
jgi:hypothetical protein